MRLAFNTLGMTDEYVTCITIKVTKQFAQQTEAHEDIEVLQLPISNLKTQCLKLEATGRRIDA